MSIYALIPARSGSNDIPNKNIITLGDFPLLAYSIAQAKLSSYVDDIVVTTDSEDIATVAREHGANVPFLRPAEISTNDSLDIDFFKHYLQYLESEEQKFPDLILFLRPTTPLRTTNTIDEAIKYMIEHPQATGLRSMHKSHITPYKVFKNNNGYAQPFLDFNGEIEFYNYPRQRFEDTFVPNGYVDIVRTKTIIQADMLFGKKMKIWETEETPDIDTKENLARASENLRKEKYQHLLACLNNKVPL